MSATDAYLTTARNAGAGDLVEGTISIQYAKDPANPIWANDPAVKLYRTIMSKYYPNGDSPTAWGNGSNYYGVALAHAFVQVLPQVRLHTRPAPASSRRPGTGTR